jgi:hypothetical protein
MKIISVNSNFLQELENVINSQMCGKLLKYYVYIYRIADLYYDASYSSWYRNIMQVLICGLLGIPPSNGVLPQAPMHTRSLAVLRRQVGDFNRFVC